MEHSKRSLLCALLYPLYLVVAIPYYWIEGDSLSAHPVFAAVYYWLLIAHGAIVLLAVIFEWIGHLSQRRGTRRFGVFLMALAILPMFVSAVAIVPLLIVRAIILPKARPV